MKIIIRSFKKRNFIIETAGPIFAIIATIILMLCIGSFIQSKNSNTPTIKQTVAVQHNYNDDKTDF